VSRPFAISHPSAAMSNASGSSDNDVGYVELLQEVGEAAFDDMPQQLKDCKRNHFDLN